MSQTEKHQPSKKQKEKPSLRNVSSSGRNILENGKRKLEKNLLEILSRENNPDQSHKKKNRQEDKFKVNSSQAEIPIKWIKDSIICTVDNRYLSMVEIMAVNFYKRNSAKQEYYMDNFSRIFKNCPAKMCLMILSDTTNPSRIVENILKNCKDTEIPEIATAQEDYIEHIKRLSDNNAVSKRYLIIFEYSGNSDGSKSNKFADIRKELFSYRQSIIDVMSASDNPCLIPEDWNLFVVETLYYIFNRQTSRTQSLRDRVNRIQLDIARFNEARPGKKKKEPTFADYIAPKGINFTNRSRIIMDGLFYSYIGIQGDSIPVRQNGGPYLENFAFGAPVDVIVPIKKLPRSVSTATLKFKNSQSKQSIYSNRIKRKEDKADQAEKEYDNNLYIQKSLEAGQDLFDCAIILVVRDNSAKRLDQYITRIKSILETKEIDYDSSFLCAEDYFKMCMPFLYFTEPFNRIKRNYLTDSMSTLYDFVSVEMLDPNGIAFATNAESLSLLSMNNFNTQIYKNANIVIFGTSGAGKTFLEQLLARWLRLSGKRCFFIIPKKGRFDYFSQCIALKGSFIDLVPGSKDCMNPLAIIPEGTLNKNLLDDDVVIQENGSLVAKQVLKLIIWTQLLLGTEDLGNSRYHTLNSEITNLYKDYGMLVNDNNSIYEDAETGVLKRMPQIEDLQRKVLAHPELEGLAPLYEPFITGNCQNFNGQTNVDLDNPYTVINVDEDQIGESMLAALLYIAFIFVDGKIKENPMSYDLLFLDEVWKMMKTEDCAKQVQNVIKLIRGYCGAVVVATQEIEDLMKSAGGFGKSVINNSEIKILLNMKESDVAEIQPIVRFSDELAEKISHFKRGQGVLISNGDATEINIIPSDLALSTITPKTANSASVQEKILGNESI